MDDDLEAIDALLSPPSSPIPGAALSTEVTSIAASLAGQGSLPPKTQVKEEEAVDEEADHEPKPAVRMVSRQPPSTRKRARPSSARKATPAVKDDLASL